MCWAFEIFSQIGDRWWLYQLTSCHNSSTWWHGWPDRIRHTSVIIFLSQRPSLRVRKGIEKTNKLVRKKVHCTTFFHSSSIARAHKLYSTTQEIEGRSSCRNHAPRKSSYTTVTHTKGTKKVNELTWFLAASGLFSPSFSSVCHLVVEIGSTTTNNKFDSNTLIVAWRQSQNWLVLLQALLRECAPFFAGAIGIPWAATCKLWFIDLPYSLWGDPILDRTHRRPPHGKTECRITRAPNSPLFPKTKQWPEYSKTAGQKQDLGNFNNVSVLRKKDRKPVFLFFV